jgi:hypothetical protein
MMNKRIEKLFNEAGFHKPEAERLGIEDKFEKFAELIVQECCDVLYDNEMGGYQVNYVLKEHFGVK